jgi:hypothetical protein
MSDNDSDRAAENNAEEQTEEVDNLVMEAMRQCLRGKTLEIGKREDEAGILPTLVVLSD